MFALIAAVATAVATPAAKATGLMLTPEQLQQLRTAATTAAGPKSPLALHAAWLTHTFAGIYVMSAVLLIVLLAIQTTRQEGLSGTIGGRVEAAYKGRVGMDKQLQRFTTAVAITFVLFATLVSLSGI